MVEQAATGLAPKRKVDYGLDAPGVQRGFRLWGLAGIVVGITLTQLQVHGFLPKAFQFASSLTWTGACFFVQGCIFYWASKAGKLRLRDKMINSIAWRGDENVLDVGCGHGLMLLAAAKRLNTGHATGIDVWSQVDQATNSPEATLENARLEGVADRVTVQSADARKLPFPDASFDVVLSSFVIHNLHSVADREQIIREINRVLKPNGQLAIADIKHTREYSIVLRGLGWSNLRRWFPNFLFVMPTYVLRGSKP
jgi:arsenite methyltransferase